MHLPEWIAADVPFQLRKLVAPWLHVEIDKVMAAIELCEDHVEMISKCLNTAKGCLCAIELFVVRFVQMSPSHLECNDLEIGSLVNLPLHERYFHPVFTLLFCRNPEFKECEKEYKRMEEILWEKSEDTCCAECVSTSCSVVNKSTTNDT